MSSFKDWCPAPYDFVLITCMRDELTKIAKTRAVKEWQKAHATGDRAFADQIAQGYGDLELAPRQLKDVSTGGAEAGVDLMMGTAGDRKLKGGYVARKMYKPDSRLHRGEETRRILDMKQRFTDDMMSRPGMRPHLTDMAGYKEVQPGKFLSYHEYIPDLQEWNPSKQGRHAESALDILEDKVVLPMDREGKIVHDTVMRRPGIWGPRRSVNPGNIAMVPGPGGGYVPKIVDFLPIEVERDAAGMVVKENNPGWDWVQKHPREAAGESAYGEGGKSVDDLRKDVFKGSKKPAADAAPARTVVPKAAPAHIDPRVVPRSVPAAHPASPGASSGGARSAVRTIAGKADDAPWLRRHPLAAAAMLGGGTLALGAGLHHYMNRDEDAA